MPTKVAQDGNFVAYRFDANAPFAFDNVASVGAGVANTTVQARLPVPTRMKFPKVCVNYSAISSLLGANLFNIVLGNGSYSTAGAEAAFTTTASGTPNHDGTVTTTINGHAVVYTEVSGDTTVTILMGHVVTAINNDTTVNKYIVASNVAGALTITAASNGPWANGITVSIASTDSAPLTFTPASGTLAGGTPNTATVVPDDTGRYTAGLGTQLPGGIAIPSVGANGQAFFATDIPLVSAADTPEVWIPTDYDGIIEQGTLLTLRVITPATTGSITNLKVTLVGNVVQPYNGMAPSYPEAQWAVPSAVPVTGTNTPGW